MIDVDTRKKWLKELFPSVHWNKGEVCEYCYSNPPSWSSRGNILFCGYCGNVKRAIAPWEIPDQVLGRLMKERVWR